MQQAREKYVNTAVMQMGVTTYVSAHWRCFLERNLLQARLGTFSGSLFWSIAQCNKIFGDFHLELESSFQVGFVKGWEGSSGLTGFELSGEHIVEFTVGRSAISRRHSGFILGTVKACHGIIDSPFVLDRNDGTSSRDGIGELDCSTFILLVVGYVSGGGDCSYMGN